MCSVVNCAQVVSFLFSEQQSASFYHKKAALCFNRFWTRPSNSLPSFKRSYWGMVSRTIHTVGLHLFIYRTSSCASFSQKEDSRTFYSHFRYKAFHFLTLIAEDGLYTTVNMTSPGNSHNSNYNDGTTIYLGGLPPDVFVRFKSFNYLNYTEFIYTRWLSQFKNVLSRGPVRIISYWSSVITGGDRLYISFKHSLNKTISVAAKRCILLHFLWRSSWSSSHKFRGNSSMEIERNLRTRNLLC